MVVVGHGRDQVEAHLAEIAPHVTTAVQEQQLGTGHAVQVALDRLGELTGEVVVTYGDVPMLATETLAALLVEHRSRQAAVTVLTAEVPDPTGYGRILRDADGVVEGDRRAPGRRRGAAGDHRDQLRHLRLRGRDPAVGAGRADPDQRPGRAVPDRRAGARPARRAGRSAAMVTDDLWQTEGVNDRVQLSAMNAEMNRRILHRWMRGGVTVIDPATTWVHASVDLAPDVTLLPGTSLEGATSVGRRRDHRPGHHADRRRGGGGRAPWSGPTASLSVIGAGRQRRPVRVAAARHHAGRRRQDRHLRGDQERPDRGGRQGAAPDLRRRRGDRRRGQHRRRGDLRQLRRGAKSTTTVGRVQLRRQQLGAGRTRCTSPTARTWRRGRRSPATSGSGELAVGRGRQRNVPGWVARKRAGTKTAQAAEAALDARQVGEPTSDQQTEAAPLHDQHVSREG